MKRFLTPAVFAFTVMTVSAAFFINGCTKDNVVDTETTSATDNNICENEFLRLLPTVHNITIDEGGVHRLGAGSGNTVASCPQITVDTASSFPVTMTINYGTGCTDPVDGKVRAGRVICEISQSWDNIGCMTTMTLDSFYVNGIHFEGAVTVERTGTSTFHKVVQNGRCTKSGATPWEILFESDKTIEFTAGLTNSSQRPIVTISGTNSGTDRNGKTWTSTITSPIVRDLNCTWIIQGTVELTPDGKPTRTVDFGTGTCDNKGTVTIEGNTFEFTMQ